MHHCCTACGPDKLVAYFQSRYTRHSFPPPQIELTFLCMPSLWTGTVLNTKVLGCVVTDYISEVARRGNVTRARLMSSLALRVSFGKGTFSVLQGLIAYRVHCSSILICLSLNKCRKRSCMRKKRGVFCPGADVHGRMAILLVFNL
jgi:hypothetical protein